jgi:predicted deacetylase
LKDHSKLAVPLAVVTIHDAYPALHGLYHEDKNGQFDDFHKTTKAAAEEEKRAGLEIFQEIEKMPNVFVPPAWKLNNSSIEVFEKLGFDLAETQEEFILLSDKTFRKIKVPEVLNWDSTGYPERNIVTLVEMKDVLNF